MVINALADPLEWLADNGSCYTAHDCSRQRRFAREIGLVPCIKPIGNLPELSIGPRSATMPELAFCPAPAAIDPGVWAASRTVIRLTRIAPSALVIYMGLHDGIR